jgi:hypothetical protein
MKKLILPAFIAAALLTGGCVKKYVTVTKTTSGFFEPTDANFVKILKTQPTQKYEELGSVITAGWEMSNSSAMYNSIRTKAAQIGANAVYIRNEGVSIQPGGFGAAASYRWAEGVAIKFKNPN